MNGFCDKKDDTCSTTVTWIKANFLKDEKLIFNNIDKKDNNDIFTNSILDKIVEELKRKRAVIISLRPDHHFLVYLNKKYIEIYQSSAYLFYLKDWMDYYYDINTPRLSLSQFRKYLFDYLSESTRNMTDAIKHLFTLGPNKPKIERESIDYYCDVYARYITKVHSYEINYKNKKKKKIHSIESDHVNNLDMNFVV